MFLALYLQRESKKGTPVAIVGIQSVRTFKFTANANPPDFMILVSRKLAHTAKTRLLSDNENQSRGRRVG